MDEPHAQQAETLIQQDHNVHTLDQSEEKQAVMEVTRLVTETEIEHGNANECSTEGLGSTAEPLDATSTSDEVHDVSRAQAGSDLAINIMSHMEISRLIANVVKRMQEEGGQSGISSHNLFHMENLMKQVVTNQNTITINQNSLLRNQQAILQKVKLKWEGANYLYLQIGKLKCEGCTVRHQDKQFFLDKFVFNNRSLLHCVKFVSGKGHS